MKSAEKAEAIPPLPASHAAELPGIDVSGRSWPKFKSGPKIWKLFDKLIKSVWARLPERSFVAGKGRGFFSQEEKESFSRDLELSRCYGKLTGLPSPRSGSVEPYQEPNYRRPAA